MKRRKKLGGNRRIELLIVGFIRSEKTTAFKAWMKRIVERRKRTTTFRPWVSILLVATVLRLWSLDSIPNGFHRDEALFGYEAYSIAKTGRDEHGRFMPLWFEGFGVIDYPLAIYPRVPFIAVMGLSVFSVRFSLVFYGVLSVFLIYLLARKLFADRQTALIAGFLAAISTWHFFMSRYTPSVLALVFLVLGVNLLLFAKRRRWNVIGGISLGLTCYCYAAYYFFLPLFLALILAVYFPEIKRNKDLRLGFVAAVLTMVSAFGLFWNINITRAPQSAFYYDHRNIEYQWGDRPVGQRLALGGSYDLLEKRLHDPRLGYVYKAALNYYAGFSNVFWLEKGRGFESNLDGFGNLLLYEPLLIMLGALVLVWKRSKAGLLLIGWVLLGPLSSAFTKDVTSTRLMHMVVPFVLLEAAGLRYLIWELAPQLGRKVLRILAVLIILAPIIFLNVLYYDAYFRHMSAYSGRWWQKGYFELINMTNKYPQKQVYMVGKWDFSYIMFAFANKYDPAAFQKTAKREIGQYNFDTVTDFDRYHFVDEIKKGMLCQNFNSIYITRIGSTDTPPKMFDGIVTSLGSDKFVYFIPNAKNCEGYAPTDADFTI